MYDISDMLERPHDDADAWRVDERAHRGAASLEPMLRELYTAYNRRDADPLLAALSLDVDWPDGQGRLHGREQVLAYWQEQWSRVHTYDEVTGVAELADGHWTVRVDQVVRGLDGAVLSTGRFEHRLRIEHGLVRRLDIRPL